MYTKQEAFDKVWEHFVVRQNPGSYRDGSCAYRGKNGTRCPIGVLIPDDRYDSVIEGEDPHQLIERGIYRDLFAANDCKFYGDLQRCHDSLRPVNFTAEIEAELRTVACAYGLTIPESKTTSA